MISEAVVIEITEIIRRAVSTELHQDLGFRLGRVRVVGVETIVETVGDRHLQEIGVTITEQTTAIGAKQPVHITETVIMAAAVAVAVVVDRNRVVVALVVGNKVQVMDSRVRGSRKAGIKVRPVGIKHKARGVAHKIRISGSMAVVEEGEDKAVMDRIMVIRTITMDSIRRIGADHSR